MSKKNPSKGERRIEKVREKPAKGERRKKNLKLNRFFPPKGGFGKEDRREREKKKKAFKIKGLGK